MLHINVVAGWTGIPLGFLSGMMQGMFFHCENWLGGHGSFKRRMYRLNHISLFDLGAVNWMYWFMVQFVNCSSDLLRAARLVLIAQNTGAVVLKPQLTMKRVGFIATSDVRANHQQACSALLSKRLL